MSARKTVCVYCSSRQFLFAYYISEVTILNWHLCTSNVLMCLCQAKRLKEQEEMLAKERWELAAIEEQRRAQEKERAKVEFRYASSASVL